MHFLSNIFKSCFLISKSSIILYSNTFSNISKKYFSRNSFLIYLLFPVQSSPSKVYFISPNAIKRVWSNKTWQKVLFWGMVSYLLSLITTKPKAFSSNFKVRQLLLDNLLKRYRQLGMWVYDHKNKIYSQSAKVKQECKN